jgi:hypothetical protein
MLVILESTNACAACYIYGVVSNDLSYRAVRIRAQEDTSLSEDSQTPLIARRRGHSLGFSWYDL